jgi:hypothetical protein
VIDILVPVQSLAESYPAGTLRARVGGMSLNVNTSTQARDRAARERLCRYAGRPAIATGRLARLPDGRLSYALKRSWRDGTTHVAFLAEELLEKSSAVSYPRRV